MYKLKNFITVAALACGLLICFNAEASAQFVPSGSYQITCNQIYTKNSTLVAYCKPKSGKDLTLTSLADYFTCAPSSITNDNGNLTCSRDENSPLMKKAKAEIDKGYANVVGGKISSGQEYLKYIRLMFADNMATTFYKADYDKLEVSHLQHFFRRWLAKPENAQLKNQIIDRVYNEVYGRGAGSEDLAKHNKQPTFGGGQTYGYEDILDTEKNLLNSFPVSRRIAIGKAYLTAMGRQPIKRETDYWLARNEYYKQMVEAARVYLYSPDGLGDLRDTVRAAAKSKGWKEQTLAQIDVQIALYRPSKKIYEEMK